MNDGSEGGDDASEASDAEAVVRGYYEAIDAKDYERFADLLASGVVHERPDRTIEGRETLVGFVRDDRPNKDTRHEVEAVYRSVGTANRVETDSEAETNSEAGEEATDDARDRTATEAEAKDEARTTAAAADCAVRGRLLDADGEPMFAFVDAFEVEDGRITRIRTYTL